MFGVTFLPVLWSPAGAPIAGVPGPRRSADECDAGWFAPVATRRRSMLGLFQSPRHGLAVLARGETPRSPPISRHVALGPSTFRFLRTGALALHMATGSSTRPSAWGSPTVRRASSFQDCRAGSRGVRLAWVPRPGCSQDGCLAGALERWSGVLFVLAELRDRDRHHAQAHDGHHAER
jgi:hypothetical protein